MVVNTTNSRGDYSHHCYRETGPYFEAKQLAVGVAEIVEWEGGVGGAGSLGAHLSPPLGPVELSTIRGTDLVCCVGDPQLWFPALKHSWRKLNEAQTSLGYKLNRRVLFKILHTDSVGLPRVF